MPIAVASSAGSGPARSEPARGAPAVVLARNDDLRILIRGILLLEGLSIALEGRTPDVLRRLDPPERPTLLLLGVEDGDDRWADDLGQALQERPELRVIVLLPKGSEAAAGEAERRGARTVLVRPIALRELTEAVREALAAS